MLIKDVYIFDGQALQSTSDIRIENGKIAAIASHLTAQENEEVTDGRKMIALPGLADAHRHVWQAPFKACAADFMLMEYLNTTVGGIGSKISADELYQMNLYGYLQAAAAGITTLYDWSHIMNSPEHADAAITAAIDSGIDVLFFHASTAINREPWWYNSELSHDRDIERLVKVYGSASSHVKLGMGIRGPEFATMEVNKQDIELARSLNIPVSMHIGSSILGKIHKPVIRLRESGLLHDRMNLVHCNTLSEEEFDMIREAGCLVSITPEAEMQMGLGNPASRQIRPNGNMKWSVGIDIDTASTGSLLFQQRLLLQHHRAEINNALIEKMEFPMAMPFAANEFFFQSQQHTHEFAGMNSSAKLAVGKNASFSLIHWNDLQAGPFAKFPVFYYLNESHIHTVIANGKIIKQGTQWLQHDMESIRWKVSEIVRRVL